jgi:hypothetical protein
MTFNFVYFEISSHDVAQAGLMIFLPPSVGITGMFHHALLDSQLLKSTMKPILPPTGCKLLYF